VVPRGRIFLGKWRSIFAGSFDGKINVQTAWNEWNSFCTIIST
jgi:hypothetical protein